ncbi:tol-pal system YbgF family protein, partial [Candidatus Zixiibacteriota bacterium]
RCATALDGVALEAEGVSTANGAYRLMKEFENRHSYPDLSSGASSGFAINVPPNATMPPFTYLDLGTYYLRQGDLSTAETYFSNCIKLYPQSPWAGVAELNLGFVFLMADSVERAYGAFERVVKYHQDTRFIDLTDIAEHYLQQLDQGWR